MSVSYQALEAKFRRLSLIDEAVGMLRWDMSVMMPDCSSAARGEQIANLKLIAHEILSSSEVADFLADAENASAELDEWQIRNLQLMRRRWLHTTAVPEDLLDAFTRSCTKTEAVWRIARHESDFMLILPELEDLLGLVSEVAKAKSEVLGITPYEALLDSYEPDIKTEQLDALFDDYTLFLSAFLEDVLERQSGWPVPYLPQGPFSKPRQVSSSMTSRPMLGKKCLGPPRRPDTGSWPQRADCCPSRKRRTGDPARGILHSGQSMNRLMLIHRHRAPPTAY